MSNPGDFTIENGVLKKYVGPGGDVVIPEGVTSIGQGAFRECANVTGIQIPDTVDSIKRYAFWGCRSLVRIAIPAGIQEITGAAASPWVRIRGRGGDLSAGGV